MPTYNFECSQCNYKQQKLVSFQYPKYSKCPKCQKNTLVRLIGNGNIFNLKGLGFFKKGIQ